MTATEILAGRYDFVIVTYHSIMSSSTKAIWLRRLGVPSMKRQALYKERLIILSGTFLSNRWWDLCGIFDLFPQPHPFNTTQRFSKAFANLQNGKFLEPTVSKQNRLVKYLMGCTLARPPAVMDMINMSVRYHDFVLDNNEASISAGWALKFALALRWKSGPSRSEESNRARAMMFATHAQQHVSGRTLVSDHTMQAEDDVREQGILLLTEFFSGISHASQSADGEQPHPVPSFKLTAEITARLAQYTEARGLKSSPRGVSDRKEAAVS
jgi:hypothetical protein